MASGSPLKLHRLARVLVGALLLGGPVSISPAYADLRVCNQTGNPVSIALGYRAERGWQSEGWWIANPQQCATVYQGDLPGRYYYMFVADDIGGGAWDGGHFMCTRDESFTIFGVDDCLARGYERTGFFEVDTEGKTDWLLELTETSPEDHGSDEGLLLDDPSAPTEPDTDTQDMQ